MASRWLRVGVVDEEYVEAVLALVDQVPHGRVTTYGALARAVVLVRLVASWLCTGTPWRGGEWCTLMDDRRRVTAALLPITFARRVFGS